MRKLSVLCLTPHIPIDETNERSAYSILLLYGEWGEGGELSLGQPTAVQALAEQKSALSEFVMVSLANKQRSERLLANTGEPYIVAADNANTFATEFDELPSSTRNFASSLASVPITHNAERYVYNFPQEKMKYLYSYVEHIKESLLQDRARRYTLSEEERLLRETDPGLYIEIAEADARREELDELVVGLNLEQRRAYKAATRHISGESGQQMIMFVSGEGGTGKSRVIDSVTLYTQLLIGKTDGWWGPVLKTGPTGSSAHNIGGSTWHSALGKGTTAKLKASDPIPEEKAIELQRKAKGTVLYVLDELSLAICEDLYEISRSLGAATGKPHLLFGGLHVLLAGDFYQNENHERYTTDNSCYWPQKCRGAPWPLWSKASQTFAYWCTTFVHNN